MYAIIITGIIPKGEVVYMHIAKQINKIAPHIKTNQIAVFISSSSYLRSFVSLFMILPVGTQLKKLLRLA